MTPFSAEVTRLYMEELTRKRVRCSFNEAAWKSEVMSVAKVIVVKAWPEWREKKKADWSPARPGPSAGEVQ